jgi:hypothetical protein
MKSCVEPQHASGQGSGKLRGGNAVQKKGTQKKTKKGLGRGAENKRNKSGCTHTAETRAPILNTPDCGPVSGRGLTFTDAALLGRHDLFPQHCPPSLHQCRAAVEPATEIHDDEVVVCTRVRDQETKWKVPLLGCKSVGCECVDIADKAELARRMAQYLAEVVESASYTELTMLAQQYCRA